MTKITEVIVSGIGLVTALGHDCHTTWTNLLAGNSGIKLTAWQNRLLPLASIADHPSKPQLLTQTRSQHFMEQAVEEAIANAGLTIPLPDCAVVIGSSRGNQREIEQAITRIQASDKYFEHFSGDWLRLLPGSIASEIAVRLQTKQSVMSPMAACATANWAIAQAWHLLQTGQCEIAIAGATDAAITPLTVAGFQRLGVMAETGAYPFSCDREGLVLGEGAAALVLETATSAQNRGCQGYGRILGFGIANDAYHPTTPNPSYEQAEQAIRLCLHHAGLMAGDVDFISAHGTSTVLNDQAEAALIRRLFEPHTAVTATKGATGHALGATGMIEAAFCLLSLHHQVLPPCTGLRSPDFDLNFVRSPQPTSASIALNFSFGFGGQNAILAFGRI